MAELFTLLDWVGALLLAGALAMVALTDKEMRVTRLLLVAGSFMTTGRWIMWSFGTDSGWLMRGAVGAVLGALLLAGAPALWRLTKEREFPTAARAPSTVTTNDAPAVGTLELGTPQLLVEHKHSTTEWAAQVQVEIKNKSDRVIFFHAVTAGRINGIAFDQNKVEFDGYVNGGGSTTLYSRRITDIHPLKQKDINDPSFDAYYEYDLHYRFADSSSKEFPRITGRGIHVQYWEAIPNAKPGTVTRNPVLFSFYQQTEK